MDVKMRLGSWESKLEYQNRRDTEKMKQQREHKARFDAEMTKQRQEQEHEEAENAAAK
jgi:hypothetical protein